jgi:hypothetical protein
MNSAPRCTKKLSNVGTPEDFDNVNKASPTSNGISSAACAVLIGGRFANTTMKLAM